MARIYKKGYKKYGIGGGVNPNANLYGNIAAGVDSFSPLTYKNYNSDFIDNNNNTRDRQQNNIMLDQTQGKLENTAISSGNPYAMGIGAIAKGGRLVSNIVSKNTTDQFGVAKGTGAGIVKGFGDALNPIGMVGNGIQNLNNNNLSTAEKIGSFIPGISTIVNNKVAKQEEDKYLSKFGNRQASAGNDRYKQAIASGFNTHGNEDMNNYKNGGRLYKNMSPEGGMVSGILMMQNGGNIHIKPENRGKFTAYKERTGETTEEALHSSNAHVRQMANFARNSAKWNHGALGGSLKNISSENKEVVGRDHEDGGVKFPQEGVELEGGETINKDFVFSKELGFADRHKPIAKAIGKIEKKPSNNLTRNSLDRLKQREEELEQEQEQLKESLNIDNNGMKKYGGNIYSRMGGGGTIKDTTYKKTIQVPNNDGRSSRFTYKPGYAFTNDNSYGGTTPEQQVKAQEEQEGSNNPFQIALRNAQANMKDTFDYKGKSYKSGTSTFTPAIPSTTTPVTQDQIVTQRRDTQSINSGTKEQRENRRKDLLSKGYTNIAGSYNYELPEKSEFMDSNKALDYLKSNNNAYYADPEKHKEYSKGLQNNLKYGGKIYKKMGEGGYPWDIDYSGGNNQVINNPEISLSAKGYQDVTNNPEISLTGNRMANLTSKQPTTQAFSFDKPMNRVPMNSNTTSNNTQNSTNNLVGGLSNIVPYADNITNFALNRQRAKQNIPQEGKTDYLNPINYNYSGQKVEADTQRREFNKSIDSNNLNTGTANANKSAGLFQTIRAKNQIQQEETNANNSEKARVSTINSGIQSRNNSVELNNQMRKLSAKDDIRREDSTNAANITAKYLQNNRDNKLEGIVKDQNTLNMSTQDPRTVAILMKSNRDIFKKQGWSDKQIDDYINNSNNHKLTNTDTKKRLYNKVNNYTLD